MNRVSRTLMSTFAIDTIQLDPGINTRTSRIQLFYGAWVNMAQVAIGLAMGFGAVLMPQLSLPESEISFTPEEASWISSVLPLFSPIGCIVSGIVMDRHGRKIMLIYSQIPMFIGWLYASVATTPQGLIIGRAITGIGNGMAMGPPRVYCTEISLPNMRGVIGSFPNMALAIGIALQAGLGIFLTWQQVCYTSCAFTFFNFCSFALLPETPYFVLQNKSEQEARDNLAKFRGPNYDLDKEMDQLMDFKADNDFRKISFTENMVVLFTPASCKPFALGVVYVLLAQAVGTTFLVVYGVELLTVANSSFDPEIGNILLGLTRVVMNAVSAALLYKIGKRSMAIISAIGVTLVCFVLGGHLMSSIAPSLIPQISLILYMAFATLGYYNLPLLIAFELYPLQVRGILGGATVSLQCLAMFASSKVKPLLMEYLGLSYTFIMFGCLSLFCIIFLYIYLPETKDLTLQEIEEYYKHIRPTLVSQRRIMSISQLGMLSRGNMSKPNIGKSKMVLNEFGQPSPLAKLHAQKQITEFDGTKTHVIYEYEKDDDASLRSLKSVDSKKMHVVFDETAGEDEDYPRSRKEDEKSIELENKDDNEPEPPKDDNEPSTSTKH